MDHSEKKRLSKSKRYLELIHKLPCCISGLSPVQAHHIRTGMGMSMKAPDWHCLPLHEIYHTGSEGIHTLGTKAWQEKFGSEQELVKKTQERLQDFIKIPEEFRIR